MSRKEKKVRLERKQEEEKNARGGREAQAAASDNERRAAGDTGGEKWGRVVHGETWPGRYEQDGWSPALRRISVTARPAVSERQKTIALSLLGTCSSSLSASDSTIRALMQTNIYADAGGTAG